MRLNARMASHVLAGRWLRNADVARSYDRLAPQYEDAWLKSLRSVTDDLLARIPSTEGDILDLGCGTGYTTQALNARFPDRTLTAVDVSAGMLDEARRRVASANVVFVHDDMLAFLRGRGSASAGSIVSAWAIGYSNPADVIGQAARVLRPGGVFAFVVNCLDTLAPVVGAFRACMDRYPDRVQRALWPRFPKSWNHIHRDLLRHGFTVPWHADDRQPVACPVRAGEPMLPWLLNTGILAGLDAVLPLAEAGPVADAFENELRSRPGPLHHHYVAAIGERS